jgi:hypothetical protein
MSSKASLSRGVPHAFRNRYKVLAVFEIRLFEEYLVISKVERVLFAFLIWSAETLL